MAAAAPDIVVTDYASFNDRIVQVVGEGSDLLIAGTWTYRRHPRQPAEGDQRGGSQGQRRTTDRPGRVVQNATGGGASKHPICRGPGVREVCDTGHASVHIADESSRANILLAYGTARSSDCSWADFDILRGPSPFGGFGDGPESFRQMHIVQF